MIKFEVKYSPHVVLVHRENGAKVVQGEEAFPSFKSYVAYIRKPKTWCGEVEIRAFVDASR